MKISQYIFIFLLAMLAGGLGAYLVIDQNPATYRETQQQPTVMVNHTRTLPTPNSSEPLPENFVDASNASTQSVVFIQTLSEVEYRTGGWMDWFFEPRSSRRAGSGSGVVFSKDGYIVTNNHVIEDADEITVTAGKRSYQAELIGTDPSSDLAVIKINSNDLPEISKGNSEEVNVGEWVLAVGNPFNLTSTVTAGIVSAKGRNINILRDKFPIESFIQTDAAINPGNSGGALVNAQGELIGINTAILSRTGSYAGYGFAIPVNIVKKVFNDIIKYGEVQKAFTGVDFIDIDSDLARRLEIENLDGVILTEVKPNGAAKKAGLKERDVVRSVNGIKIKDKSSLEELIAKSYPGDELNWTIEREADLINKNVILTNRNGGTGVIKRNIYYSDELEASFETVSAVELDAIGIESGVKVIEYKRNGFFASMGIPEGFIVTQINNRRIDSPEELSDILSNIRGRFDVIGIDARGRKVYYPFRR